MSSKRRIRSKSCEGKIRHASQNAAYAAIHSLRRNKAAHEWLTAYRCAFCSGYHVGHPPQKVRQGICQSNRATR